MREIFFGGFKILSCFSNDKEKKIEIKCFRGSFSDTYLGLFCVDIQDVVTHKQSLTRPKF